MPIGESGPQGKAHTGQATNFPIVPVAEIPAAGKSVDSEAYRPMVLVVDGEAAAADTLAEILKGNGYAAIAAYDGEGALENAFVMPPQVVISDVELPGMSGIELAIELRSKFPDCRFLLFSRNGTRSDPQAPARYRGQEFEVLGKPILPGDLLARVAACLMPR